MSMLRLSGWSGKICPRAVFWTNGRGGAVVVYSRIFGDISVLDENPRYFCPVDIPGVAFEVTPRGSLMANARPLAHATAELSGILHVQNFIPPEEERRILDRAVRKAESNLLAMREHADLAAIKGGHKFDRLKLLVSTNQEYVRVLARLQAEDEEKEIRLIENATIRRFIREAGPLAVAKDWRRPFVRVCAGAAVSVEDEI